MSEKEDSMKSFSDEKPIKASIVPISTSSQVESILMQALSIDETGEVNEPTCEICMSAYRSECEQLYKENTNYKVVVDFLKSKDVFIVEAIVQNHFQHHVNRGVREKQMQEYVGRLKRMGNKNLSTLDRISLCFDMLTERLMGINSLVPSAEESEAQIEKIKSQETNKLMGTIKTLLQLQASILGEMRGSGELITIPTADFVNIFNEAILNSNNDRERMVISDLLTKLEALSKSTQ